ncbi:MAG TPA: polyphenol oxidase family protein [bacterium]|nr:polyphenol oxidase family protein [bacterium]
MNAENEYTVEQLRGPAGALWLDAVGAFDGVAAAFATRETLREGPAAGFEGPVLDAEGRINEEYVARLCSTVGFPYGRLASCRQVHGTAICRVDVAERRWYDECDGLATNVVDAPLAVFTADCVPVVLWAARERALAVLHAGWRGTLAKIVVEGVSRLEDGWRVRAADVAVFLGPAVGPCCYDVGDDVARAAEAAFGKRVGQVLQEERGKRRLDLHRANELAAQEAGVPPDNVYRVATCTSCEAELFASHRRDGAAAGRMMAVASIHAA